ncbi:ComEC/Rec2 family competence protein [Taibaiella koreensis]|uniref:ComEC/Rec2 family competence protein n=1 Tax=Taibaiella koreensis TaxID=1268548 RepID=UPI000E59F54F|nr:ComEC/Rec2 family competence protein [Taibaiella koreensis]
MTRISRRPALLPAYPFLWLLSTLCAGILLWSCFPRVPSALWLLLSLLSGSFSLAVHLVHNTKRYTSLFRLTGLAMAFLFLGAALSSLQDVRSSKCWYGHYLKDADALVVTINDFPKPKARSVFLPVTVSNIRQRGRWLSTEGQLQLYIYKKEGMPFYRPGQVWLIPAKLNRIKASGNPNAFDYAHYAARQGLFHQAFLSVEQMHLLQDTRGNMTALASLRQAMQHCLDVAVKDSVTRSLIAATVLNERAALDEQLWQAYSITGIVHIIAISGMHIVLLGALILLLFRCLPFRRLNTIKYLLAILAVWLYVALTGFPPSAVRAAVMFSLSTAGLLLHRNSTPVNIWAATGFLLLCYNPFWLYDVGVQLSFLAVLSILLFYAPVRRWYRPRRRIDAWLWDAVAISIAAQVLVAPLVIYYFHQFPLMGLIANLPAALYSMLLLYGSSLLFLLYAAGLPCIWLGDVLTALTSGFNTLVRFLAAHTPGRMQALYIDVFEYWLLMLAVTGFILFLWYKRSLYLFASGLGSLLFLADLVIKDQAALQQKRVVVYNVARVSAADVFTGKQVRPVFPDTLPDRKTDQYTLLPARLAFRATAVAATQGQTCYISGKRILFLDHCAGIVPGSSFPVDFLVVSSHCAFDPEAWYYTFHPRMIIIDGSLPRWKALQWKAKLSAAGAPVHWVQEDGAWSYPPLP